MARGIRIFALLFSLRLLGFTTIALAQPMTDVCGSSRLRLHSLSELQSLQLMDSEQPTADLEIDLTGDGHDEYLRAHYCGNASCEYVIYFQEQKGQYRCLGEVSMHRKGFTRLLNKHNDFYDLLIYNRSGAGEGNLGLLQFDGRKYQTVHSINGIGDGLFPFIEKTRE